jgi:hypothetical protein
MPRAYRPVFRGLVAANARAHLAIVFGGHGDPGTLDARPVVPGYTGRGPSVGAVIKALHSLWGQENSDPAKVAQVILRLAVSDRLPAHLLLGSDAVRYAAEAEAARAANADRWRETSVSTDADAPGALAALRF